MCCSSFPVTLNNGMKDVRQYALKKNVDSVPAFAETIAALEQTSAAPDVPSLAAPGIAHAAAADNPPLAAHENLPPAADNPPLASHCPNARSLVLRCLLFPLYPMLGKRDVEAVCRVLSTLP